MGDGGIIEELHHVVDAGPAGRVVLHDAGGVRGGGHHVVEASPGGGLHVGRVPAARAPHEVVLPHHRRHHELVVDLAPDGAGLGLDRRHVEVQPVEDPQVGVVDGAVGGLHGLGIDIEGVGIAHDQLRTYVGARTGVGPRRGT